MIEFDQLVTQFTLGNAAILTNVCLLPLYPGLIAFLAANADNERAQRASKWLGVLVLAGVLTLILALGLLLFAIKGTFGDILEFLLPVIYISVVLLGAMMLSGRNPFAKLATTQAPVLKNPYLTAYLYGILLAPMTLPCVGPIMLSALSLASTGGANGLAIEMTYVLAFGLGFGWPLVVLPFFATAAQRRFTQFFSQRHMLLTRVSGILLVAIGILGMVSEWDNIVA